MAKVPWTDNHTAIMHRHAIAALFAGRRDFYTRDGIKGQVDEHGNDRTARKYRQMVNEIATLLKVPKSEVQALKAEYSRTGGGGGKKANNKRGSSSDQGGDEASQPTKKRARNVKVEEVVEVSDSE